MNDWTVQDLNASYSEVKARAVNAALRTASVAESVALILAIRAGNAPGATVDMICDEARDLCCLRPGTLVLPWAGAKRPRYGLVLGRTDEQAVRVLVERPSGLQEEEWASWAFPEEAPARPQGHGALG